jgi:hypothetical protein
MSATIIPFPALGDGHPAVAIARDEALMRIERILVSMDKTEPGSREWHVGVIKLDWWTSHLAKIERQSLAGEA